MIDSLSVAVHALPMCMLTSLSVDEILLLRYMNRSTNFRCLLLSGDGSFLFKAHNLFLFAFTEAACSRLCSRYLAWAEVFMRSAKSSQ